MFVVQVFTPAKGWVNYGVAHTKTEARILMAETIEAHSLPMVVEGWKQVSRQTKFRIVSEFRANHPIEGGDR